MAAQDWGVVTAKGKTAFVHLLNADDLPYVFIPGWKGKLTEASCLQNGKKIKFMQQAEGLFLYKDGLAADEYDTIIQLNIAQ